jgi:membrane protease YdiL (CAAX protease family)
MPISFSSNSRLAGNTLPILALYVRHLMRADAASASGEPENNRDGHPLQPPPDAGPRTRSLVSRVVAWMAAPWRGGNVLRQVLAGAAVGAATISAVIGIIVAGGWATLAWSGVGAVTVLSTAVPKLVNTLFEEIIFRGIMLRTLEHWRGSYLALALSALVFGAIHLSNPDGSLAGATGVAVGGGILLGAA